MRVPTAQAVAKQLQDQFSEVLQNPSTVVEHIHTTGSDDTCGT
jgi:hypothetical protein